jgi:hypothetical protein
MLDIKGVSKMNNYNHYIEINPENKIIDCFTSANKQKRNSETKIAIGKGKRQFDFSRFSEGLFNKETGEPNYTWNSKEKRIEEVKINEEEVLEKEIKELERKYISKIQEVGIDIYRSLAGENEEIASLFEEYDNKRKNLTKKEN